MNNRKIPFSFFVLGVIQCVIRYFLIGVAGIICLIVGFITHSAAVQFGIILLLFWILISILDEIRLCYIIKKGSDNAEVNEIFDKFFGEEELMKKALKGKETSEDVMRKMKKYEKGDERHEE